MLQVRAGVGRLAAKLIEWGAPAEERSIAKLLLPALPAHKRFRYYYRLIRYAGFPRRIALHRALFWTL